LTYTLYLVSLCLAVTGIVSNLRWRRRAKADMASR
jgi:hypothetical protein